MLIPPPPAAVLAPPSPLPPTAPTGPHVIVNPDWVTPPDPNSLAAAYPDAALRLQVAGFVLLRCGVAETGRLTGCEPIQEAPAGLGFGAAAVKLAGATFRMTPRLVDGEPTPDGVVSIPLSFSVPGGGGSGPSPVLLHELQPGEPAPSIDTGPCPDKAGVLCVQRRFAWASAPAPAALTGLYGGVAFSCRVGVQGSPEACRAGAASPGAHVEAAEFWAHRFKVPPQVAGQPTADAVVRFIILPPGPAS